MYAVPIRIQFWPIITNRWRRVCRLLCFEHSVHILKASFVISNVSVSKVAQKLKQGRKTFFPAEVRDPCDPYRPRCMWKETPLNRRGFPFSRSTISGEKRFSTTHNDRQRLSFHESFCPAYTKWNWKCLAYIGCGGLYLNICFLAIGVKIGQLPVLSFGIGNFISGLISKEWYSNFPFHPMTTPLSPNCVHEKQTKT